ncbi:MAG: DUF4476 domain-containing protein [Chitinophagaceae bacterium]|jgi:hypothetical protein|nr:DUF4476 domain-containing protein [Ignavibacterium sp.]MBP9740484.1 DUF4476 domain-containing protein [Chitinophagaceae bacterium]
MKRLFKLLPFGLVIMLNVLTINAFAQKRYFVYLQAEDKQPFYVMINQKNYSSSINGHLVIPKLKNGKYFFVAGFPKDKYPEQKFTCVVDDKDQGFVLKQFGNTGWGLFNLVTFKSVMANAADWEKEKSIYDTVKIDDDMALVPTKVNNISENKIKPSNSINNTPKTETKPVEQPIQEVVIATPPKFISADQEKKAFVSNDVVKDLENNQPPQSNQVLKRIVRTLQKGSSQGLDEIYIDFTVTPSDTIALFIPINSIVTTDEVIKTSTNLDSAKNKTVGNSNQYNKSCVYLATENDFARTRKLMSLETTDDKMISTAKKAIKGKCFTVEQVKALGLLFLAEQNRLKFFTTAKSNIYDVLNFSSLESEFTLSNLIEQFRKLLN